MSRKFIRARLPCAPRFGLHYRPHVEFILRGGDIKMKKFVMLAAAVVFATAPALVAADKTWTGVIGDSRCNAKHSKAEHGAQTDSDHDCVNKCVDGGQKY